MIIWLPTEATLLFVNFLLFDCCVCSCLSCYCHGCCRTYWFEIRCLRRQKTVIGVSLWVTMTSMYFTQRTFDEFSKCELSASCRSRWAGCLSGLLRVSGLLERPAQGEQPAQAACSGWAGCLSGLLTTLSLAKKNIVNVNCSVNLPYLFIRS